MARVEKCDELDESGTQCWNKAEYECVYCFKKLCRTCVCWDKIKQPCCVVCLYEENDAS